MAKDGCEIPLAGERKLNPADIIEKNRGAIYSIIVLGILMIAWYFAANRMQNPLLLPYFQDTVKEFINSWSDPEILSNLGLTLKRVFTGFGYAFIIGVPLGLLMGYSRTARQGISPILNSLRQIPIMAWVPLAIVWFGLGDGPTVFLIAVSATFPLVINTIAGVQGIDPNYYNAARSMGASLPNIIRDIVIPEPCPVF